MSKKKQPKYSQEQRRKIVDGYYSKKITSSELASKYSISTSVVHRWKYELDARLKTNRKNELIAAGRSSSDVKYIMHLEEELAEYKKLLGEAQFENEILKKLHNSQRKRKSTGLESIRQELGLSKRLVK